MEAKITTNTTNSTFFLSLYPSFPGSHQIEAVYRFCVTVNPSDVIEVDPVLGERVLCDPLGATALFQSVSKNLSEQAEIKCDLLL